MFALHDKYSPYESFCWWEQGQSSSDAGVGVEVWVSILPAVTGEGTVDAELIICRWSCISMYSVRDLQQGLYARTWQGWEIEKRAIKLSTVFAHLVQNFTKGWLHQISKYCKL